MTNSELKATDKQIALLSKGGRNVRVGLTKGEASLLVEELINSGDLVEGYTLADFERYDPHAPGGRRERRFCCPGCIDKPVDKEHRCLSVNVETGLYVCHRCQLKGQLKEHKKPMVKTYIPPRERARQSAAKIFAVAPRKEIEKQEPTQEEIEKEMRWRGWWHNAVELMGTEGATYLKARAIPLGVAEQAGCRFSIEWYGRPAVLFPVRDREGELVAVCGRYIDGGSPKTQTGGPKSQGVFYGQIDALKADCIAVCEGPLDALALSEIGIAAVAMIGVSWPTWLPAMLAFKNVLVATDNDDAGNDAAAKLTSVLSERGAHTLRFKSNQVKDWAEWLEKFGPDNKWFDLFRAFGGACDDDYKIWAAFEFASKKWLTGGLFLTRLIDIQWRTRVERKITEIAAQAEKERGEGGREGVVVA